MQNTLTLNSIFYEQLKKKKGLFRIIISFNYVNPYSTWLHSVPPSPQLWDVWMLLMAKVIWVFFLPSRSVYFSAGLFFLELWSGLFIGNISLHCLWIPGASALAAELDRFLSLCSPEFLSNEGVFIALWTHLGTDVWVWAPAYCLSWYVTMRGAAKPSVVSQGLVCAAELSRSKVGQGGRLMAPAFPSLVNKRNRISSQSSSNSSGWYYAPNKVFPSKAEERWFVAIEFQLFAW